MCHVRPLFVVVLVVLGGLLGCNKGEKVTVKKDGKELSLTPPAKVSINQGETEKVKLDVKRKDFSDPVEINLDQLPKGVTVVEEKMTVPADADSLTLTLKADPDAPPVQGHEAKVSASGGGMKAGPVPFRLDVKEKKK